MSTDTTCSHCGQAIYQSGSVWRSLINQAISCPSRQIGGHYPGPEPFPIATTLCNPPQNERKLQFVGKGNAVLQGSGKVAVAVSKTFARRIANALNAYTPSREGK